MSRIPLISGIRFMRVMERIGYRWDHTGNLCGCLIVKLGVSGKLLPEGMGARGCWGGAASGVGVGGDAAL